MRFFTIGGRLMKRLAWLVGSSVMLPLVAAACGGSSVVDPGDASAPTVTGTPLPDGAIPDRNVPPTTLPDGARSDAMLPDGAPRPTDAGEDGALSVDAGSDAAVDPADAADGAPPPRTCGVGQPNLCSPADACLTDDDCEGLCTTAVCAAPTHTDGKLSPSLGETAIDCGGPDALVDPTVRCENAIACMTDTDCKSSACSPKTNTCVAGTSCAIDATASVAGIETCGVGETPSPGASHDSCCASLPLPVTTTRRLDKYEITAGRIRRFVEAVTAAYGTANVRDWAKAYAAANPGSQLEQIDTTYPGLFDILPATAAPAARLSLVTALGLFAVDPINALDGCYVSNGSEGHSTYHWDTATRSVFRLPPRVHSAGTLDEKPINCTMSLMYMAFCAWDGGELARMTDYREVWGSNPQAIAAGNVYVPWATMLDVGQFNWRNGQHGGAVCVNGWPGCVDATQPIFYRYPTRNADNSFINLSNDSSPLLSAPGRFDLDVTQAKSANGQGWYDIGGLLLESGWVDNPPTNPAGAITNFCDTTASPGPGETACIRGDNSGVLRYAGALPHLPLVGYSWEGHARYNESYLASRTANPGSWKPVTWQYGKGGGRCARTY